MERSMALLRAKRIDLMQVHNLVDVQTQLATLREWKSQGRIRYLGITHYEAGAFVDVEKIMRSEKLDFVQINYSLMEREAEERLLPLAQERGVAVIVNRPFGGGDLFSRTRAKPLPDWAAEFDCHSWAQFFLKWIVANPAVTCAIPATNKPRHLEDNMRGGIGRLPDAKMRQRMVELVIVAVAATDQKSPLKLFFRGPCPHRAIVKRKILRFLKKISCRTQSISAIGRALYAKNNPLFYSRSLLRGILPASGGSAEFFRAKTQIWLHGCLWQKAVD